MVAAALVSGLGVLITRTLGHLPVPSLFLVIATGTVAAALLVAIAVLQVLTELFVTRHYGMTVVFITPMTLGLGHLAHPTPAAGLIADRLVQTSLGVAVAAVLLLAARVVPLRNPTSPRGPRSFM